MVQPHNSGGGKDLKQTEPYLFSHSWGLISQLWLKLRDRAPVAPFWTKLRLNKRLAIERRDECFISSFLSEEKPLYPRPVSQALSLSLSLPISQSFKPRLDFCCFHSEYQWILPAAVESLFYRSFCCRRAFGPSARKGCWEIKREITEENWLWWI